MQPPQFQQQHVLPSNDYSDRSFGQSYQQNGLESTFQQETSHMNGHQANEQLQQDALGLNQNFDAYSQQQPDFIGKQGQSFENNFMLDPQLDTDQQPQGHINPQDIMSDMSSPQNMVPTPPNLMPRLDTRRGQHLRSRVKAIHGLPITRGTLLLRWIPLRLLSRMVKRKQNGRACNSRRIAEYLQTHALMCLLPPHLRLSSLNRKALSNSSQAHRP